MRLGPGLLFVYANKTALIPFFNALKGQSLFIVAVRRHYHSDEYFISMFSYSFARQIISKSTGMDGKVLYTFKSSKCHKMQSFN